MRMGGGKTGEFTAAAIDHLALRIGLRALLAWGIIGAGVFVAQRPIAAALLPFFHAVVGLLQQDFVASLRIAESGRQAIIEMTPFLLRPVALTDQLALRAYVSLAPVTVDVDHALVPPVLMLAGVAAWPLLGIREAAWRVLLALASLPIILALCTPVLLVGLQQMLFVEAAAQHGGAFHEPGAVTLMIFMESGGRWLLPLMIAVACVALSRRLCAKPEAAASATMRAAASPAASPAFPPI